MTKTLRPGDSLLFMKIGVHANESLEEIIKRKSQEIRETGYAYWGYGGNTCHPKTVQPFAADATARKQVIYLVMQEMDSRHFGERVRADEYSIDGVHWHRIPETINVVGSRFALVINTLEQADFDLPLRSTRVAVGNCAGRPGDKYVVGRVDKACLQIADNIGDSSEGQEPVVHIGLRARLQEPYAVYLRNRS